jgi:GT2 family glycosyltransferase
MIHVCVPVLRRYDLLRALLWSLQSSTVPYEVHVLDNGRDTARLHGAAAGFTVDIVTPTRSFGVAESWNWFIKNVPEERIIVNDDVTFAPDSLERMAATTNDLAWSYEAGFSCFLIRDACVEKIGLFDETISPGYAYYEDEDYMQRVNGKGTREALITCGHVECGVSHPVQSQTLKAATRKELGEHHRRFQIARANFAKKWGAEAVPK